MPVALILIAALAALPHRPVVRTCGLCSECNCSLRATRPARSVLSALQRHEVTQYDGKLLGVRASVLLDRASARAIVSLSGPPIGPSIRGMAWFKKDGESVEVETDLYHALGRRGVSIINAGAYKDYSYVWVRVKLPLGLGTHRMILPRTSQKTSIHAL